MTDPTANLREQLRLAAFIRDAGEGGETVGVAAAAERLAELVEALDGWIRRGGLLPTPWRPAPPLVMYTSGTRTGADGAVTRADDEWRAVERSPGMWAICNAGGDVYGAEPGRSTGYESYRWAEDAMRRIARRWGYRLSDDGS